MSAAARLLGLSLENGWRVIDHLQCSPHGTGGLFSHSYVVERSGKRGFLKAFDFSQAFGPRVDTAKAIQHLVECYNHERMILDHCRGRRLSKVVVAIDNGEVQVPGMGPMEGRVFYLIFEMADGDIRIQMNLSTACDALWCMHALKDITLALWQVHKELIAHQDAKPSNVLVYPGPNFKIADFGRASRKGQSAPHDHLPIAGDQSYAPPEQLYGFSHPDFIRRRMGCDLFMLGNLAAFLFSGVNVTARLVGHLDAQHHPNAWTGSYDEALPYVLRAFTSVLNDLHPLIDEHIRDEVFPIIKELCEPDLGRRGHPRGLGKYDQFSLERYVSTMNVVTKRLEFFMRPRKRV